MTLLLATLLTCTLNGHTLHGRVQIIDGPADIRVQVVDSFPDLQVELVPFGAHSCGQWIFVETFPDFTIEIVNSFPELRIQYVE